MTIVRMLYERERKRMKEDQLGLGENNDSKLCVRTCAGFFVMKRAYIMRFCGDHLPCGPTLPISTTLFFLFNWNG